MRSNITLAVCLLFVTASAQPTVTQTAQRSVVLYEGARLITGDGAVPIETSAFLVDNDRFVRVGRKGEIPLPSGGTRVDLTGKTVIPGLIDTHAHIGYMKDTTNGPENYSRENVVDHMKRYAFFGVAAAMSMGSDFGDMPYEVRDAVIPNAARFVMAGRGLTYVGTGTAENTRQNAYMLSSPEEARTAVRELAARKIVLAKTWIPPVTPPIYTAIFDEAHRHNMRVWAHVTALPDVKAALRAGLDGLAHLPADLDAELLALLKARPNTYISMTPTQGGRRNLYAPWLDGPHPLVRETTSLAQIQQLRRRLADYPADADERQRVTWEKTKVMVPALVAAGVKVVLGTDAGGRPTGDHLFGWTAHTEVENMVAAGMTPAQVIVASTKLAAESLGIDDLGTIAPGKSAAFVVLDDNPLDDITNTRKINKVYLRGKEVDRAALRNAWSKGSN
jgi:imidazolonepropionase-like amidohydrolase